MKVQKSEDIDKLATALCKFQGAICGVKKNAKGYNYDYTNLEAILKAIQEPLNDNGLSVVQFPINSDDGGIGVFTQLQHISGQYICSEFTSKITDKPDIGKNCQAHGSLVTYYRRYALQSVLNLASADDDGQSAKDTFKEKRPDSLQLAKKGEQYFAESTELIGSIVRPETKEEDFSFLSEKFTASPLNKSNLCLSRLQHYGWRDLKKICEILEAFSVMEKEEFFDEKKKTEI